MRQLCFVLVLFSLACHSRAETVWIDTDVSIGSPIREVDDAFALILAFHSPEIRLAGLSTTYGNARITSTTRIAQEMVRRFGRPAGLSVDRVFAGAASARELGRQTTATDALAVTLRKRKLTYIALGPLTNLATFLQLHPDLAGRFERVILVGGLTQSADLALGPSGSFRIHDANIFKDPAAARMVLRSKVPLVLMPIKTVSRLMIDATDLRELNRSGPAGSYLASRSKIWLWFWTSIVKTNGGPIFDAPAIIPTTRPDLLSMKKRYAGMDQEGNLMVTPHLTKGARPVQCCTGIVPGLKRFVMQRLVTQRDRE